MVLSDIISECLIGRIIQEFLKENFSVFLGYDLYFSGVEIMREKCCPDSRRHQKQLGEDEGFEATRYS